VLASHLGRPKGGPDPKYSLHPAARKLEELLGRPVVFGLDCVGPGVEAQSKALRDGEVLLLENVRFHPEEEKNDEAFAKQLAALCDGLFVCDAFGSAHRAHASVVGITKFVRQAAAGLLMEKELAYLGKAVSNPARPFVAILGGAKVSDKIEVVENLMKIAERFRSADMAFRSVSHARRSASHRQSFIRFSTTSILSLTFAPPRIATNGRAGLLTALPRYASSFSISNPAAA